MVKGRNIYEKTTAAEWNEFEQFISVNGPFDLVVDGLNIAHVSNSKKQGLRARPSAFNVIYLIF